MSTKYFLLFPPGTPLRGPVRCDPYSGWVEVDGWSWGLSPAGSIGSGGGMGPGKTSIREVHFWRKADSVSARLGVLGMAATSFKRIVFEIWDDVARTSKGTIDFIETTITSYQAIGGGDNFTIDFDDMKMTGAWPKSAAIAPAALQVAWAKAARRPPTAARG